jgi:hypothetical protein
MWSTWHPTIFAALAPACATVVEANWSRFSFFMVVVQQIRHPLGHTAVWQGFAAWVAMHMPSFS